MERNYPHLLFKKHWSIDENTALILGQCEAYIRAIKYTPILPSHYQNLMHIALLKGAQATTAIEGNTLSDEDIEKIMGGLQLPPSKEYQETEVKNLLDSFNVILNAVVEGKFEDLISIDLIKHFHALIGKDLGEHFQAIPGHLRENEVTVAKYRCPDHRDIEELLIQLIEWLKNEFRYKDRQQPFHEIIIQAIISHVYIEWIHPFSDGNGRTGRLIEFYILLRGGSPDITSHLLSNHYNQTRTEYYRQLQMATNSRDLTAFLQYALTGLRDGLAQTLEAIQVNLLEISWQKMVYDKFDAIRSRMKVDTFKRQRAIALASYNKYFTLSDFFQQLPKVVPYYMNSTTRTIKRDIDQLSTMNLLKENNKQYSSNLSLLQAMVPRSK
jgi:Fic family protein